MDDKTNTFLLIMLFYLVLSYVVGPLVGYYAGDNSLENAGHGFVIGSVISIVLWYTVGRNKLL